MLQEEYGEVLKIEGPLVKVRMPQHGGCASCGQRVICFPMGRERVLIARAQGKLNAGDGVMIMTASAPAIISSLLVFIGPIILLISLWFIFQAFGAVLWVKLASMGLALVAYFVILSRIDKRLRRSGWFLPRAVRCDTIKAKGSTKDE